MPRILFAVLVLLAFVPTLAHADIPLTMSLQAVLDSTGGPPPTGSYTLTFKLYNAETLGTLLYTEVQVVSIVDGLYSVVLGSVNPLDSLAFDAPYWLSVEVGSGGELTPRIELASSPYSLNSLTVVDGAITDSKIDSGVVVRSLNGFTEHVTLVAGPGITIDTLGPGLQISADSSGGVPPGGGNTLDLAYDQNGAGVGRTITADTGPVEITAPGTNDALKLIADATGTGKALEVSVTNAANAKPAVDILNGGAAEGMLVTNSLVGNAKDALLVTTKGTGSAGTIMIDNAGNGDDALVVTTNGTGSSGRFAVENAANAAGAIAVTTNGSGEGVNVSLTDATNTSDGVHSETAGRGFAVYGLSGAAPGVAGQPERASVAGESKDFFGVSGFSNDSIGVYGKTVAKEPLTGDFRNGVAGVKGESANIFGDANSWGVIGQAAGYGSGVLGVGGKDKGAGVLGIAHLPAGGNPAGTIGVRGVTREGHWSYPDDTEKGSVAVLGQAKAYVGVWGESTTKVGVVGTVGSTIGTAMLPPRTAGVFGEAESDSGYGVHGRTQSVAATAAGVKAEGRSKSALPRGFRTSAALEIRNGAIRVSGMDRPAGIMDPFPTPMTEIFSCRFPCDGCDHDHVIGWTADDTLSNNLIFDDSIVLLTASGNILPNTAYGVQLLSIVPNSPGTIGKAVVRVYVMGTTNRGLCTVPPVPPKVNYLIINPFPPGM